jgi:hypothetical protein
VVGLGGRLAVLVAALALVPSAAAAPGSAIVRSVDVGDGAAEAWVFLPEHRPDCVVVLIHDVGDLTPVRYDGLADFLAIGKDCATIYPRYQAAADPPAAAAALRGLRASLATGFAFLRGPQSGIGGKAAADALPVTVAGVGYGGTLAFAAARNAKAWGLPVPGAVDSIFPAAGRESGLPVGPLDPRTHVLIQVGDQDRVGGSAAGRDLWKALASHPAGHKRYQLVRSTGSLRAAHSAPLQQTAAAESTFWLPLDDLIDATVTTP